MEQIEAVNYTQQPEYMDYPTGGNQIKFDGLQEKIVNVVDKVTSFPDRINQVGDNLNDRLVDFFQGLKKDSTQKIQGNLTSQKTASFGRKFGAWLGKGNNFIYAGAGLLLLIILIVRR